MSEDKLTVGNATFSPESASKRLIDEWMGIKPISPKDAARASVEGLIQRILVNEEGEPNIETIPQVDFFKQPDSFRQQLAARLGCDVDKVTVENLVAVYDLARFAVDVADDNIRANWDDVAAKRSVLAPFKREVG